MSHTDTVTPVPPPLAQTSGGGTKAFYGGVARGAPLDMGVLRGISSYEPTELVVTVRAGTLLRSRSR